MALQMPPLSLSASGRRFVCGGFGRRLGFPKVGFLLFFFFLIRLFCVFFCGFCCSSFFKLFITIIIFIILIFKEEVTSG